MRKLPSFKRNNDERTSPHVPMTDHNFKIYLRVKPSQDAPDASIIKIHTSNRVEIVSPYYSANDNEKNYNY